MATQPFSALPPSPPPSPPRRRHKKKHADPFLDLDSSQIAAPSPPSSPNSESPEQEQESLVTRIVVAPVLFVSFLLSLFLVNRRDRQRRSAGHASSSVLSYFSPAAWIDPEPYQDPADTTWGRYGPGSHVEPHPAFQNVMEKKRKKGSWHLNKKIRKVARLEISDAFEIRGRVIVVMLSVVVLIAIAMVVGVRWGVSMMWMRGTKR